MSENKTETLQEHLKTLRQDAVLWKAKELYKQDATPDQKEKAIAQITTMLCCINKQFKRDAYIELLAKELKIKRGALSNAVNNMLDESRDKQLSNASVDDDGTYVKLPDWANPQRVHNHLLDWQMNAGRHTGYYFVKRGNALEHLTNFVLQPLFHIYDRTGGNRRLARLHNAINADKLIELPSKALNSIDRFEEILLDEGYYLTLEGFAKPHLKRLVAAIGNEFPKTYELKTLGWQPEGFFAYSNAMYCPQLSTPNSQLSTFNDIGVAQYKNINYYSPAASSIYMTERKDDEGREVMDDDAYENDKYLRYQQSPVSFTEYAQHMMLMHGDAGMPLICYAFVSIFKDIITQYEKIPILYGYGIVQSGKSTWAEGLYYMFYDKYSKPFNLNQGTVYAFFNRMERFRNCPQLFNEFDEDFIDEDFFRAFKSFYDGEGRDRGKGIKGKTETQKINCTVILVGQTLTTKDGASVLIRSIPVNFKDPGERSDVEKTNYDTWNAWTNTGVNSCLTEIIQHRAHFKQNFFRTFNEELVKLKESIRATGDQFKERIAKNYCILLASGKVMMEAIVNGQLSMVNDQLTTNNSPLTINNSPFGFSYSQLYTYCRTHIISLSKMISEVDNLAIFWKTVAFLYERGDIQDGIDFKVEEKLQVTKFIEKEKVDVPFDKPTKVLYIRLTKAYPLYAQNFKQTTGTKPTNERTLVTYFESSKQYIGNNPGSRFKANSGGSTVTSSYMFLYDKLGINLEKEDLPDETRKPEEFEAKVKYMPELVDAGTTQQLKFVTVHHATINRDGLPQTIELQTKCFSPGTELKDRLFPDTKVKLLGMVAQRTGKNDAIYRTMDVEKITILSGNQAQTETTQTTFDADFKEVAEPY
jgi:hypothetical protein